MKAFAGIAAAIGGGWILANLKDLEKWSNGWLFGAGLCLVAGTLIVRFMPDFYYKKNREQSGR